MLYLIQYFILNKALSKDYILEYEMKISNKKYRDLISRAMSVNGRKETLDLLYEAAKFNKNWIIFNLYIILNFSPNYNFINK